jgi:hypothetical protein
MAQVAATKMAETRVPRFMGNFLSRIDSSRIIRVADAIRKPPDCPYLSESLGGVG